MGNDIIFRQTPSLVINVTNTCNMGCIYCPPNGENVEKSYCTGYDEIAVLQIINLAKHEKIEMIRFTGGEPFLAPERLKRFIYACENNFKIIQINTNGLFDKKYLKDLSVCAKNISLKFSLDSICQSEFLSITQKECLPEILNNIDYAISIGFRCISINTVLTLQSFESVKQLINYAVSKNLNIKLLTVSSYSGEVNISTPEVLLEQIISYLEDVSNDNWNTQLIGNRGISMMTYKINNSLIYLVDHSCKNSKTPERTYFSLCKLGCNLFPCESGAISLNLSSNGCLSVCRGNKVKIGSVFFKNAELINKSFYSAISQFDRCVKMNVNNL